VENSKSDNEIFAYDPSGNRTSDKNEDYYIYNEDNELLENTSEQLEYDNNGNLVKKSDSNGTVNYDFNIKNRLVKVEKSSGDTIATYYYDPFGRRLWKEVNGTRTYFFYSEQGLVAEFDEAGNQIKSYGYKSDSKWTTDPVFIKDNDYNFYINDHIGTPQKIINEDGNVVWSGKYKGFGKVEIEVEEVINNLRFAGQYYDEENGFYYNMHRYYNVEAGRYFSSDPIGLSGGINTYLYVLNNPIIFIDPLGLELVQLWRPLSGGLYPVGYHTAIKVNGIIYGFGPTKGVHIEDPSNYGWGRHEVIIHRGNDLDKQMLDFLQNAAAGNNPRFTVETYDVLKENCMTFADTAIETVVK